MWFTTYVEWNWSQKLRPFFVNNTRVAWLNYFSANELTIGNVR